MSTKSETVLAALAAALKSAMPTGVVFERNAALPEKIAAKGHAILRDGDPGQPSALMSPVRYIYEHRAEIDLIVEGRDAETRDARFDTLKTALGTALAADRTLGGLTDYVLGDAPAPLNIVAEGAEAVKAATVAVTLTYETSDPLA
ncbi:acyl-CoA transferase [Maritimibacter sp. 55A14]|uniref:acyl-CoA transferase n=1 Tax=Maritimibacter sp. 55A14 TaxID=2174844 RepID=UPI000D619FEE|nr:acyl-CoA transferase [Maritimibacter sp. 55A14]PWE32778.1 acyl-CoA transferase [Maritimibacter sp. 55A14]